MTLQAPAGQKTRAVVLDLSATDRGDLCRDALNNLDLEWQIHNKTSPEQAAACIAGRQVVVTNKVVIDRKLLIGASDLKLICISATGTNNVDLLAARELGIDVCNVTGYATPSVVQYVFSVMLSLFTKLAEHRRAVNKGEWSDSEQFCLLDFPFHECQHKTLGIVGYGELGSAVAKVARAFGMKVLVAARNTEDTREGRIPLKEMLPQLDVLSLHCLLNEDTKNLISKNELNALPKGALVINSARGGIVNEQDLLNAIESGHLGGAATDVLSTEPPSEHHLLLQKTFDNLIITPHIAWASVESRQRLIDHVAFNISEYMAGRPRNIVN